MLEPLAATGAAWLETIGRLHPAVVHFPIALLVVAGGLEFWRLIRRQRASSPTAFLCLVIGTIASIVAVILGLIDAKYTNMQDVSTHQWLGIATAVAACVILTLGLWNRTDKVNPVYRVGVIALALLVGATGYYGGELTYGQGYLTELVWPPPASTQPADSMP
jgi:uncharacterized membrane protein